MASYKALYGRRCHSPMGWFELGEARLLGTGLVHDDLDKVKLIQDRLCTMECRQKSYADRKVRDVAYMVGVKVAILERQVRKMRSKDIASVKVQWRGQPVEEATWETEREL
ncbi:uncharacterized protein [Nicotiana tomentosiformis]|uniref:uncharacterized protein n=1 Tax=Nicotiana tomentosiformis TaxID=4098 RepID=UPI00388C4552